MHYYIIIIHYAHNNDHDEEVFDNDNDEEILDNDNQYC